MKQNRPLRNRLKAVRTRLGMSQQELATAAGLARQTIGGIESGTYALSLTNALQLAHALQCPVEELFWLEGDAPHIDAFLADRPEKPTFAAPVRVCLAQIDGQWIATPLTGQQALRTEMIPADGLATWQAHSGTLDVELLDTPEEVAKTVVVAGCTPALSLWTRSAERWHPGLRVRTVHANSTRALQRLAAGEVHIAGLHFLNMRTGEDNESFVRRVMGQTPTVLVHLGVWEEGFLVACGNPHGIRTLSDIAQSHATMINREIGAGSRLLLDTLREQEGVPAEVIHGYDRSVPGHWEVAEEIAAGRADIGVSTAAVAATYGLDFVPLRAVRYDLAIRKSSLLLPAVQHLLDTLQHRHVRQQLSLLVGHDTSETGEMTLIA